MVRQRVYDIFHTFYRYYGASQPFDSHKTSNLKWLTSRHALADMAVFITLLKEQLSIDFGDVDRKVIVVGGSYPGAMAAWFKAKYPHLANAAWASSAVVNAIDNFNMFDYQIYNSTMRSNQTWTKVIQNMTMYYDQLIDQKDHIKLDEIKKLFGAVLTDNGDFAFYLADLFVGPIQYGNRTQLCSFLQTIINSSPFDKISKLADYTKGSHSLTSYDRNSLRVEDIVVSKSSRQWTYQYCTEFGYFQTPYKDFNMRSKLLTYNFWTDYCTYIFGEGIALNAKDTNSEYGSINLISNNIFFVSIIFINIIDKWWRRSLGLGRSW